MTQPQARQRWSYRTRPHETGSRVVIGRVDGDVVHLSLDGLVMCGPGGRPCSSVAHLPVRLDAVVGSLAQLEGSASSPDGFAEGIETWRAQRGGVFTATLREIVETLEWGMSAPTDVLDHLVREMRGRQLEAMIDDVMRAVRKQPTLVFLSEPGNPSAPLLWKYENRSECVVVFTEAQRAHDFAERHGMRDSRLISPPSAEAAFDFLRRLHADDGIEWASVNAGHECDVPFYLEGA